MNFNPWHSVSYGDNVPHTVNAVIEIPRNSRAKYELDKETGMLKLDRVLYSSVYYPANYGFVPQTYCDDNDPLDILVLSQIDMQPLCLVEAKIIGVMRMLDQGEADDKLIAVCANDMSVAHINDINEICAGGNSRDRRLARRRKHPRTRTARRAVRRIGGASLKPAILPGKPNHR
jgi:inorganic pyrophosphatase